ncbi:hypothetical protein BABINDRAFT_9341 [Babjeviella inositovora NRRL Y-12698]|uniref:Trafficking protein particle complex subunit 11 domain-containing protein n=1 Tax=Babjeviella inositovora NRRL Y-12698 TaxID=984486 RepID=A0A1E3QNL4_9ASCO|nr:uncharacterized protein BABINDRAFT_9341 [Babjeviella inositovora NRRL Y-12698]ODQ78577.1 hypothetical protein BABINDRAFT_9341 [Babjeviella inositovora NRRL Y-12698]
MPTTHIGYYDPFDVFPLISTELRAHLPLTNVHWKPSFTPAGAKPLSLRSIPALPVQFAEEIPNVDQQHEETPPLLRMMLVQCDSLDIYRAQVRPLVQQWLKLSVEQCRQPIEWLIVFYAPGAVSVKKSTALLEKLKVDFNGTGERVVKICGEELKSVLNQQWNGLMSALKISLVSSFDERISLLHREEAPERYQSPKESTGNSTKAGGPQDGSDSPDRDDTPPGSDSEGLPWIKFLVQMEKMALLYQDLKMFQDAMNQYRFILRFVHTQLPLFVLSDHIDKLPAMDDFSFTSYVSKMASIKAMKEPGSVNPSLFQYRCHLFVQQTSLLQQLSFGTHFSQIIPANFSVDHLLELLACVKAFVTELLTLPKSTHDARLVAEWSYVVVDGYLKLLSQVTDPASTADFAEKLDSKAELAELLGDLQFAQRSNAMFLANSITDFRVNLHSTMDEISLDEPSPVYSLTYPPLVSMILSKANYISCLSDLTQGIIKKYSSLKTSTKPNTVDALSIDLAMIECVYRQNYATAKAILRDSFAFYYQQGWSEIGGFVMELYLKCLENLMASEETDDTTRDLLMCYLDGLIRLAHLRSLEQTDRDMQGLWKKLTNLTFSPEAERLVYPLGNLWRAEIFPYIEHLPSDRIRLSLTIVSPFNLSISVDSVSLSVRNVNDFDEQVVFDSPSVVLSPGKTTVSVESRDMVMGHFQPCDLTVRVNSFIDLVHDFSDTPPVFLYPHPSNLTLDAFVPLVTDLGGAKTLSLRLTNGIQRIAHASIEFWSGTPDLNLLIGSKQGMVGRSRLNPDRQIAVLSNSSDLLSVRFSDVLPQDELVIDIPYLLASQTLKLKAKLTYENEQGEVFSHVLKVLDLDIALPVGVTVQDLFKSHKLYARFSVGVVNNSQPLRIGACNLTCDAGYDIATAQTYPGSVLAFMSQPVSVFYKIEPKDSHSVTGSDTLRMHIRYRNLHEECLLVLNTRFQAFVADHSEFADYLVVFQSLLKRCVFDLVLFSTTQVVTLTSTIQELDPECVLNHIRPEARSRAVIALFSLFLQPFQVGIIITNAISYNSIDRQLYLPVPIPLVNIIHMVEFQYDVDARYVVGEPIEMRICVDSTRHWRGETKTAERGQIVEAEASGRKVEPPVNNLMDTIIPTVPEKPKKRVNFKKSETESGPRDDLFVLDLQTSENWLVSGNRRANFQVAKDAAKQHSRVFNVVLAPLKVGKLPLPKVTIRYLNDEDEHYNDEEYVMVVDNKNETQAIMIIPELDQITFTF